jgi:hypothetical protein
VRSVRNVLGLLKAPIKLAFPLLKRPVRIARLPIKGGPVSAPIALFLEFGGGHTALVSDPLSVNIALAHAVYLAKLGLPIELSNLSLGFSRPLHCPLSSPSLA